jgi:hypothetical protein
VGAALFCRCDPAVAAERYALRAGSRDAGHFDAARASGERWNDEVARPVAGGWPVIEVDTAVSVDLEGLIEAIRGRGTGPGLLNGLADRVDAPVKSRDGRAQHPARHRRRR